MLRKHALTHYHKDINNKNIYCVLVIQLCYEAKRKKAHLDKRYWEWLIQKTKDINDTFSTTNYAIERFFI